MLTLSRHRYLTLATALLLIIASVAGSVIGRGFNFDNQVQLAGKRYGIRAQQTVSQWRDLLLSLQDVPRAEQIDKVNAFFNRHIVYTEDIDAWHVSDYWETPLEAMGRGVGDCEDFAIAKYFSLLILGIPSDQLRITYVKARIGGPYSNVFIAHMVLAYYPSVTDEPVILDNLIDEIRPASRRPDLTPVFGFNSDGVWLGAAPGTSSSGSSTARLSRWRDLIARMHADGFE